ncbi:MAG: hypothetical protein R6U46_03950 [Marinilabilia sp.]
MDAFNFSAKNFEIDKFYFKKRQTGRRIEESQNARLSRPCAMAGNFGFRGLIGLNGLDLFVSFWGNAKKKNNKEIKN